MAPSACQTVAACPPIRGFFCARVAAAHATKRPLASGVKQEADPARPPPWSTEFLAKDHRRNGTNRGANAGLRGRDSAGSPGAAGHTQGDPDIYDHDERPPPAEADGGLHVGLTRTGETGPAAGRLPTHRVDG